MIFTNQSVQLAIDTGIDLTDATVKQINYRTPAGVAGSFTVTDTEDDTVLLYQIARNVLTQKGIWRLQAHVEFSGDIQYVGGIISMEVHAEL